jgi:GWxTD domain-containing protein
MHELAHIRRLDYVINMLQSLVEDAMFYNPAVWWISKTIRIEREHCCDDVAVNATQNAAAYASALAALELNRSSRAQQAIAATGGSLVKRIRRILHQPEPASPIAPLVAAGVAIFVVAGFLAARPALPERKAITMPAAQTTAQSTYQTWLNEDVLYIITNEERVFFQNLRTDEERQAFVEQFWLRRDPTPGTIENEFRTEHYRRIEYANSHFSSRRPSGLGWKTDRGRIYIQFGPPDQLESHAAGGWVRPNGAIEPFPSELWLYARIEGIGSNVLIEFIDQQGTEEYPMIVDPNSKRSLINGAGRR